MSQPNLNSPTHTEECIKLIRLLAACHRESSWFKQFMGECSDISKGVEKCLKKERQALRDKNYETSMSKKIDDAVRRTREKREAEARRQAEAVQGTSTTE